MSCIESKTVAVVGMAGSSDDGVVVGVGVDVVPEEEVPDDVGGVPDDVAPEAVVPEVVGVDVLPDDVVPDVGVVEVGVEVVLVGVVVAGAEVDVVVRAGVAAAREFVVLEPPHPMRARADARITAKQLFRIILPY